MPVMDEFKKERESIKTAPFSKKLEYFRDYYLLKTLAVIAVALVAVAYIHHVVTEKEQVLYVTLVNFSLTQESAEELIHPFAETHINTKKQEIVLDHSSYISADENEINFVKYGYEDEQRLFSMVMTGSIDLFISGEDVIERYAAQQWFDDLSTVLNSEELAAYEKSGRVVYHEGIPVAIKVTDSKRLNEYYVYNGKSGAELCAGFCAGGLHRELAKEFLCYLLD